jgi:hypothetical protein
MPVGEAHYNDGTDALAGSFPSGCEVRLYAGVADVAAGPQPSEELTSDGGYAPAAGTPVFSDAVDGVAEAEVDFGTSTDAYSDVAVAWALLDADGDLRWWDLLQEEVEVAAEDVPVTATLHLYPGAPR